MSDEDATRSDAPKSALLCRVVPYTDLTCIHCGKSSMDWSGMLRITDELSVKTPKRYCMFHKACLVHYSIDRNSKLSAKRLQHLCSVVFHPARVSLVEVAELISQALDGAKVVELQTAPSSPRLAASDARTSITENERKSDATKPAAWSPAPLSRKPRPAAWESPSVVRVSSTPVRDSAPVPPAPAPPATPDPAPISTRVGLRRIASPVDGGTCFVCEHGSKDAAPLIRFGPDASDATVDVHAVCLRGFCTDEHGVLSAIRLRDLCAHSFAPHTPDVSDVVALLGDVFPAERVLEAARERDVRLYMVSITHTYERCFVCGNATAGGARMWGFATTSSELPLHFHEVCLRGFCLGVDKVLSARRLHAVLCRRFGDGCANVHVVADRLAEVMDAKVSEQRSPKAAPCTADDVARALGALQGEPKGRTVESMCMA